MVPVSQLCWVIAGDIAPVAVRFCWMAPAGFYSCPSDGASACDAVAEVEWRFRTRCAGGSDGPHPVEGTERAEEDDSVVASMMERTSVTHLSDRDITTLSGGESGVRIWRVCLLSRLR